MYIPLRILFTGVLFYAAYRFGKSVGKEEEREKLEDKRKSTGK
jgi:archaeosine-15-forming tRNA-guanine transglycosylase